MTETTGTYTAEPIVATPDPTGVAAKLIEIQSKSMAKIAAMNDPSANPREVQTLSDVNSIVQWQKIIQLQGQILTELQVLNSGKSDNSTWIDEAGNYYQSIATGDTIRTFSADGEIYIPVGKSRPADAAVPFIGESGDTLLTSYDPPLSTPGFVRRQGTHQLDIEDGAKSICIIVSGGEVTCDRGEGVLIAGDKLAFADPNGLSAIVLNGNTDADYLVAFRYVAEAKVVAVEPETLCPPIESTDIQAESEPEEIPMTGDLLPAVHDLSLAVVEELAV
jgi:hypothetical protein